MLHMFTSGRDYRPGFFWGGMLPPNAVYARVLAAAESYEQAGTLLTERGAPLYLETLRDADRLDLPAAALHAYATKHFPHEATGYVLVRTDADIGGNSYRVPRFHVYQLMPAGVNAIGRIRIVDMGRPTDPEPTAQLVSLDNRDDPVPMPEDREGPIPADNPVSTAVEYPPGPLGARIREIEARLPRELIEVRDQLDELLRDLALSKRTADPRFAAERGALRIRDLARTLDGLYGDAYLVESVLRAGN